jgi:CheY-like chemotaxis protein
MSPRGAGVRHWGRAVNIDEMRRLAERLPILIVEDDDDVRELAVSIFEVLDCCHIHSARNGGEGLAILAEHPEIVLAFTDIRMPVVDGQTFAREALKLRPGLKLVFATGYASTLGELPAAFPVVRKPYRIQELVEVFKRMMPNWRGPSFPRRPT